METVLSLISLPAAAVLLLIAYLLGSIPFGYLIVRFASGSDIRETGSGGTGATNVTRKAGKGAGILTLLLDALKGVAAVAVVGAIAPELAPWAGLAAVIGHCFPVWLGFKAGKGVATGLGVFAMLTPYAVLAAAAIFLLIVWRTRYVSLGSIVAALVVPIAAALINFMVSPAPGFAGLIAALCLSSAVIIFKHSENIQRLREGRENRFGAKA
ncbi:MAG: glycerol-3-phosphate 1-O-acyltransferase PlsY [Blastocatellales bacterium]